MSDTPRTDALVDQQREEYENGSGILGHQYRDLQDHARNIEHELSILTKHAPNRAASIVKMARENERMERENADLRRRLAEAERESMERAAKAKTALEELEWSDYLYVERGVREAYCPVCGSKKGVAHEPSCSLHDAIRTLVKEADRG